MFRTILIKISIFLLLLASVTIPTHAAVWQWSSPVMSVVSTETNDHPRAFLWIPPNCTHVRAVVVGQHNMLEEGILEHPAFRKTLTDLGIAEVWVTPNIDVTFDFTKSAGDHFNDMMTSLAHVSGYSELQYAPVIPIGHSALASYPWNFAAWDPNRTLAVLSVHGDAPQTNMTGSGRPNPAWADRNIDGVPSLMVMGEYEWWESRLAPAEDFRMKHPDAPIAFLADAGHGHFDFSDQLVTYLAMFISKAAQYRLPKDEPLDGPFTLIPIDPTKGWLVDRWRHGSAHIAPAAPYSDYKGDKWEAFWCFDKEMAQATENYYKPSQGKLPQLLGFVQDGQVVQQIPGTLELVHPKFEPLADGISFHLSGTFLDSVPAGNPQMWTGLPAGAPVGHATGGGSIEISRISGPVVKTGPDTFAISFYRMGFDNPKRSSTIWLIAKQAGDSQYKSAVQQASVTFPLTNTVGTDQTITFPSIPDQPVGTKTLTLGATSDAGVPVSYYVRQGPAEVSGNTLTFTDIPPRSKFPVAVTVVAWQYGRSLAPQIKSAVPVTQTFSIVQK